MSEKSLQLYRPEEYVTLAQSDLTQDELTVLTEYLSQGGHPLSPDAAARMFQLFLNGSNAAEIHRLNKAFPLGAILDAQIRYKWTDQKDKYAIELQDKIREKVLKAQLETTELMTDLLSAARKKHGDKVKKYLQTGNDEELKDVLNIDSLNGLMKITEGLLKITGQDKVQKIKTENTQNVNVNLGGAASTDKLEPEDAAAILNIITNAKKRKSNDGSKA